MKRLSLILSGLFLAASMTGCCCSRYAGGCSPCAQAAPGGCAPCGASYAAQVQPAYAAAPVSYGGGQFIGGAAPVAVGNPGCSSCNNLSY